MHSCQHENQKDNLLGHDGQLVTQQLSYLLLSFGEINVKCEQGCSKLKKKEEEEENKCFQIILQKICISIMFYIEF